MNKNNNKNSNKKNSDKVFYCANTSIPYNTSTGRLYADEAKENKSNGMFSLILGGVIGYFLGKS